MIAYKFLAERSVGPFTGFPYVRGEWVNAVVDLARGAGIHACRAGDLPYWVDAELWRIELAGETHALETQIVAPRARLLDRIDAWNARTQREFAEDCAARTTSLVEAAVQAGADAALADYATDAARFADLANAGGAAYIAAVAADAIDGGFTRERAWQARRLVERLRLDENLPAAV
jgi:hypothetical protein